MQARSILRFAKLTSNKSAPPRLKMPSVPVRADKRDDKNKGLIRNPEDCDKGCIGGNPPGNDIPCLRSPSLGLRQLANLK